MAYAHDTKPSPSYSNDTKPSDSFDNDNKGGTTLKATPMGLLLVLTHTVFTPNSYTNDIKP